ncbi:MAG: 5'/3'-nucleotidase SurE [Halobacteriales archaeon]
MDILLTNDDGIDSPGIRALHDALSAVGDVLVVAPATDQSAIGRAMSREVTVEERELGYAIEGTPADCVVAGLEAIGPYPDLVVAGINRGANLGAYSIGRSGTVAAAIEGASFGLPSMAVSLYIPADDFDEAEPAVEAYDEAARAASYLAEQAMEAGVYDDAEYLNVNVPPTGGDPAPMRVTRPSETYDVTAAHQPDGTIKLRDRIWDYMEAGLLDEPTGTDRRAVMDGFTSVSPLVAPHTVEQHPALDAVVADYPAA